MNAEFARFSQRGITRNYEPSSRTARNCAEQGVGFCGQRSALCVRDCRPHGSHNAAMCDFSAVHTKRQPIAEFWVRQGVRFCTRGSVRRYVTERARFSQRSITRNYALATKKFLHKAANSGILGETRREVLHERERTSVRDRTGMVLTTQYHAKLRIGD